MKLQDVTIMDSKQHKLLDHFSFHLGPHDKIGVIGEEGNGKSTLLKAIYNSAWIEDEMSIRGTIDTQNHRIGYFAQALDPMWDSFFIWEYLLKHDVLDQELDYNELSVYEQECLHYHIPLSLLHREEHICTLSGGERVKLRLLKMLHQPCDVLLLDEPSNDLDIPSLQWLTELLNSLQLPMMFISHDEQLLEDVATGILHMEQRNKKTKCHTVLYQGIYRSYIEHRESSLKKERQIASKQQQAYKKKKEKLNQQKHAVHDALNDCVRAPRKAAQLKKKMHRIQTMEARFEKEGYAKMDSVEEAVHVFFQTEPLPADKKILELSCKELCVEERVLLYDYYLNIRAQDHIVITGENGCGKSVLMKSLHEMLKDRSDLTVGYMPQNYSEGFDEHQTAVAFLSEDGDHADISRCCDLLGCMRFTSQEMGSSISELSEGQKAKLYLLRFIKIGCHVLLLDEPTRNLSPLTNPIIRHILKQYQGCLISASHDRSYIKEVGQKQWEIKNQRLFIK